MRDVLRRQWRELRLNLVPREFFYWFVQNLLLVVIKVRMRVQLFGGEHYSQPACPAAPATLVISSHKRDWDPLLCATHLYYQRGWWRPDGRRMAFVGREDMLSRGFLAEIVALWDWPRWASWLFDHVTLAPILTPLRAYPIVRPLEFSTRQYLFELREQEGNVPLTAVFSDEFLEQLDHWAKFQAEHSRRFHRRNSRELSISDVLTWDYREPLMPRLRRSALLSERYGAYKTRQRAKITRQLRAAVGALERGDTLWLAPDGMITQDGAPRRVRESLHGLLEMMPPATCILPANITYDFMTTNRTRACLSIAPPLQGLAALERANLGKAVTAAITGQAVVTMTMLGSHFLWECLQHDQPVFTFASASAAISRHLQTLTEQGAALERGLRDARRVQRRLRAFLAYGLRHRLLSRQPDGAYRVDPAPFQQQRDNLFWLNPRYPVNELAALEAALAQAYLATKDRG